MFYNCWTEIRETTFTIVPMRGEKIASRNLQLVIHGF